MTAKKYLFMATLIGAGLPLIAGDNLIQNGSFENFTIKKDKGKWKKVYLDNWGGKKSELWTNALGKKATDGDYKIEIDLGKRKVDSISQIVPLETYLSTQLK